MVEKLSKLMGEDLVKTSCRDVLKEPIETKFPTDNLDTSDYRKSIHDTSIDLDSNNFDLFWHFRLYFGQFCDIFSIFCHFSEKHLFESWPLYKLLLYFHCFFLRNKHRFDKFFYSIITPHPVDYQSVIYFQVQTFYKLKSSYQKSSRL